MAWLAITREISASIAQCELTHVDRTPIDLGRARQQHDAYEAALTALGCQVIRLAAGADMPDSVFVEDTAIVVDEVAIATRPGAVSRRIETSAVTAALSVFRAVFSIEPPATIDGGDVLVIGRRVFVGETARTNAEGLRQTRGILSPYGYSVEAIPVRGCLHLKSALTALDEETVLVNPEFVDPTRLAPLRILEIARSEPMAANVLRVGARLLAAAEFPRTLERLNGRGYDVTTVENSELAKAEGAVTCGSLIFRIDR